MMKAFREEAYFKKRSFKEDSWEGEREAEWEKRHERKHAKSARANESSSVTDWRSNANLEACELQIETTRHKNLTPAVTKLESWDVETLRAQDGEGMRAGQRHYRCGGGQTRWEAVGKEMGKVWTWTRSWWQSWAGSWGRSERILCWWGHVGNGCWKDVSDATQPFRRIWLISLRTHVEDINTFEWIFFL